MSLAQLYQASGRRHAANEVLRPAYECFTEGFATFDLREAKMMLDELQSAIST
jgi:hypothetical protein